jgi:DNA-binding GntR family transcriptional regulator
VKRLQEDILSGRYKPGDRLNESSIAREFQMSRIPVREALFELREVGLLMSHERRGMFVTSLSEQDVQQINAVRIILEAEAFRLAKDRMTPKVAATLKDMVEKIESASCNASEAATLDLEFHRSIWAITGNEYLTTILDPLAALSFAHNLLERVGPSHKEWRPHHHQTLLKAVLGDTGQDVVAALKEHLGTTAYKDPVNPESDVVVTIAKKLSPRPKKRAAVKKVVKVSPSK